MGVGGSSCLDEPLPANAGGSLSACLAPVAGCREEAAAEAELGSVGNAALGFTHNCFHLAAIARPFVIDLIIYVDGTVNKNHPLNPPTPCCTDDSFVF